MAEAVALVLLGLAVCTSSSSASAAAAAGSVLPWREEDVPGGVLMYDHRALVLNGTRRMLFSGEMHYPRSTPEVM
jgi:hypothetical protein